MHLLVLQLGFYGTTLIRPRFLWAIQVALPLVESLLYLRLSFVKNCSSPSCAEFSWQKAYPSLSKLVISNTPKRTRGAGVRIFKMSPLHHHFQKLGYPEPKIVLRFFIVGIMLAVFTIITLKLR